MKKSDNSAQCCLGSNMSKASLAVITICHIYYQQISTERAQWCGGWSYQHGFFCVCTFSQRLWVFPVRGAGDLSRVCSGSLGQLTENEMKTWLQLMYWRRHGSIHSESVTKSLNPGTVAAKSTQKSQYCKGREGSSGDIQATATLKAILTTSQLWQSTNTPAECQK